MHLQLRASNANLTNKLAVSMEQVENLKKELKKAERNQNQLKNQVNEARSLLQGEENELKKKKDMIQKLEQASQELRDQHKRDLERQEKNLAQDLKDKVGAKDCSDHLSLCSPNSTCSVSRRKKTRELENAAGQFPRKKLGSMPDREQKLEAKLGRADGDGEENESGESPARRGDDQDETRSD